MSAKTPDDYLKEMMQLYSRSQSKPEPSHDPKPAAVPETEPAHIPEAVPEPKPIPETVPEPIPETIPEPVPETAPEPVPETEPEPMPEPMPLPELPPEIILPVQNKPLPMPEQEPAPDETSYGWIQVTTRAAGDALPLEGVSVLILKEKGMETELLMSLITDQSGKTPKVKLPAPPIGDERSQPYSTYQIRAYLPGYSRMESSGVPVFAGITSIQPFELIPLPIGSDNNQPAIINQNTEPTF